ncbi:T9SS type A sorting domain-containing protein [Winogradskyella luteola]|uniref:T9SS type A sorting domain-containing protein n=1 Tax=Winogradskyella luteola TaxID=2828330 RepID=A0A9X1JSR9_9FLAO|nr:T9SS type A sorting domain-containing protein [Winogradskyella luteola]MBV7269917.1 T9SS type A sorting domain-containing protein [Winogradskyella luteola]
MKKIEFPLTLVLSLTYLYTFGQVTLNADGPGNTYELITSVLAPGYNPIEVPDCNHSAFGRHIDEVFDAELNKNVFRFSIHTTPDNDRCINFDRQRNEIKSYDQSPDNLLGVEDEVVIYKWKFKLDADFQVSPNFTHLHQLKSVGGSLASMPMYTLTARKSNPDCIELRYAETDTQITLLQTDLTPFKGHWLNVTETITYGNSGTYTIIIKKESDDSILLNYSNNSIINWRPNAEFVRPKWGIYRSLNSANDLRDESVLYSDFSIEEVSDLSITEVNKNTISLYPNPVTDILNFKLNLNLTYDKIEIYNSQGKLVQDYDEDFTDTSIDISSFETGFYSI